MPRSTASKGRKSPSLLSISPCFPDWHAVFYDDEEGDVFFEPIACFALYKTGTTTAIGAMVPQDEEGLCIAEERHNFIGIAPPGEGKEDWSKGEYTENKEEEELELEEEEEEELEVTVEPKFKRRRRTIK